MLRYCILLCCRFVLPAGADQQQHVAV